MNDHYDTPCGSTLLLFWHYLELHPALSELGKPAQIWCDNLFEVSGIHSFVPLQLYHSRCVYCIMPIDGEHVLVVVPLVNN